MKTIDELTFKYPAISLRKRMGFQEEYNRLQQKLLNLAKAGQMIDQETVQDIFNLGKMAAELGLTLETLPFDFLESEPDEIK